MAIQMLCNNQAYFFSQAGIWRVKKRRNTLSGQDLASVNRSSVVTRRIGPSDKFACFAIRATGREDSQAPANSAYLRTRSSLFWRAVQVVIELAVQIIRQIFPGFRGNPGCNLRDFVFNAQRTGFILRFAGRQQLKRQNFHKPNRLSLW